VVFLRKVRTASGATAVQIAERVGGRDKVIEHLGSAHTDAELAVLLETGRRKMHEGQGELDLVVGERDPREAIVRGQVSRVLIEVVEGAWRRLGFDVVGDAAFFQLVLARVVEPTSKADSVRVLTELGVTPVHRNTFTATLKRCGQRGYRDQIAAACFTYASTAGDVSLVLYDVTTLYFEAAAGRRPAQGRLFEGTPGRPADHRRSAGRPARVPAGDRLLGGQQGRDAPRSSRSSRPSGRHGT
jgi:hypothetical protein